MASIQVRHTRACATGRPWTSFSEARRGCTCVGGPTYYVVVRDGRALHRERVGKDRQQAERALRKIGTQVDEGEYRPQAKIRFRQWGTMWLAALRRPKESTRFSYGSTIAHASEAFGDKVVRRLSVDDVSSFLERLARLGLAPSTQAKHLRVLGACLQAAARHGYAARNPVRELDKSEKPSLQRRESAYFETDELPRLFVEMEEGLLRTVCLVALKTGMRQGELLALVWSDVDLHESTIRVRRTRTRGRVDTPKNREATSDLLYKGALKQTSHSEYSGLIKVMKGAQGTDAYQANRNLVLSEEAVARSIPQLEIEANEVRCTHGATVSPVEEEHLFYLMSRGIDRVTAQKLIVFGFFGDVLDRIRLEQVREGLARAIAAKVEGEQRLEVAV